MSRIAKPKGERKQQERPSPGTRVEPSLVCPRCQSASLIWGKSAWGCSDYRVCRLVIPFVVEGVAYGKNLASLVTARKVQLQRQGKRVTIRLAPSEEPAAQVDKGSGITARPEERERAGRRDTVWVLSNTVGHSGGSTNQQGVGLIDRVNGW